MSSKIDKEILALYYSHFYDKFDIESGGKYDEYNDYFFRKGTKEIVYVREVFCGEMFYIKYGTLKHIKDYLDRSVQINPYQNGDFFVRQYIEAGSRSQDEIKDIYELSSKYKATKNIDEERKKREKQKEEEFNLIYLEKLKNKVYVGKLKKWEDADI